MILENHSLNSSGQHLVYIKFPLISVTWFYAEANATSLIMRCQLVLQVFYSVISVYILDAFTYLCLIYEKLIFTWPLSICSE